MSKQSGDLMNHHHRGDIKQGETLEQWLLQVRLDFSDRVLSIDQDIAELWGKLRVPDSTNSIDKLVASTALINRLTVVTRNTKHLQKTGVQLFNPFES